MPGQWTPIEVRTLAAAASTTFNIGTPRTHYFISSQLVDGGGGGVLYARLNGDAGANYTWSHHLVANAAHAVQNPTANEGIFILPDLDARRHKSDVHLVKVGPIWLATTQHLASRISDGVFQRMDLNGRWAFDVNINSITISRQGGGGTLSLTGTIALYGRD